mmetsp:Transcript_7823/g.14589  ORF Transcript_7823/g.14589 Transcript_7823/m.14589 type:complete len:237 (+) Transcript_7823:1782-2492(+)
MRVYPYVVLAHKTKLLRPVQNHWEVSEPERGEDDIMMPRLYLIERVLDLLRRIRVESIPVNKDSVRAIPALGDSVQVLNQLLGFAVIVAVYHRNVALVPVVVVQEIHDGMGLNALSAIWQHADCGAVETKAEANAHLFRRASPGDHGKSPQSCDLLHHLTLVVDRAPRTQEQVDRVRKVVVLVHHHRSFRVYVMKNFMLRTRLYVVFRPHGHVPYNLADRFADVDGVCHNFRRNHL